MAKYACRYWERGQGPDGWPGNRRYFRQVAVTKSPARLDRSVILGSHLHSIHDPLRGAIFERTWMGQQYRHPSIHGLYV
jgi:hypothetical protein